MATKKTKPFIVICMHDREPRKTFVTEDYNKALKYAGDFWKNYDLNFDLDKKQPFYVDPNSGYDTNVDIQRRGGKIRYVGHIDGDCGIWILHPGYV